MKKITTVIISALFMMSLLAGCGAGAGGNSNGGNSTSGGSAGAQDGSSSRAAALAINDIKSDPFAFTGVLNITGVNAGFYQPDAKVFFIVDTEELLACKNLQCGAFQLPAIYTGEGPLPELADELTITGSWGEYEIDGESVPIFEVEKIDIQRNIMHLLA
ncbi:MAG: hypothetical protein FWD27_09520 [Coriobacteriia bacterium]|nr:hypothetical protein [Coriobacteriia bacterium]